MQRERRFVVKRLRGEFGIHRRLRIQTPLEFNRRFKHREELPQQKSKTGRPEPDRQKIGRKIKQAGKYRTRKLPIEKCSGKEGLLYRVYAASLAFNVAREFRLHSNLTAASNTAKNFRNKNQKPDALNRTDRK